MGEIDIAFTVYIIIMAIGFFISYKYGSYMIRKTGLFLPQSFIAGTIIIAIDVLAIIGWAYYSWGINEFIFIIGIFLGLGLIVVSEVILITVLLIKRKLMIQTFNDNLNKNA
jgi:peptidoglycan biosynthesis protein MviN/MurJ (putative lipid II flippase)